MSTHEYNKTVKRHRVTVPAKTGPILFICLLLASLMRVAPVQYGVICVRSAAGSRQGWREMYIMFVRPDVAVVVVGNL